MSPTSLRRCFLNGLLAASSLMIGGINLPLAAEDAAHSSLAAQDKAHIDEVLKGLNRGRSMGQVAIAPDGKRLAWIEMGKEGAEIRVAPVGDLGKSERVTAAGNPDQHCREGELAWEPDSRALAFFSDCAKPGVQTDLYLSPLDGNAARRLTELNGYVEEPAFAPDGQSV